MVYDRTLNTDQQRSLKQLPQVKLNSYRTQGTDNFRDLDFSLSDYKKHHHLIYKNLSYVIHISTTVNA